MTLTFGKYLRSFVMCIRILHSCYVPKIYLKFSIFSVCLFGLVDEPIGWIFGDLQQGHFATLPQEPVQD